MNQIFDSTDERYTYTIRHLTVQVRTVIVQRTFCPLHIRYIILLLLIWQRLLVDRSLFVTCPLQCATHAFNALFTRFAKTLIAIEMTFVTR